VDGVPSDPLAAIKKMHIKDYNCIVAGIDAIDKATSLDEDEKKD